MAGPARALAAIAAAACLFAAAPSRAGAPTDELKARIERVVGVLGDRTLQRDPAARRAVLRRVAQETFAFEDMARRALGRHWATRTPAEREEFVGVFTDVLEQTYIGRVLAYGGERVLYLGESQDGARAEVRTKVISAQGIETAITYRMARTGEAWRAYDVIIEGVSLVANYRSQFDRVLQTGSFPDLVRRLRERRDRPEGGAPPGRPGG